MDMQEGREKKQAVCARCKKDALCLVTRTAGSLMGHKISETALCRDCAKIANDEFNAIFRSMAYVVGNTYDNKEKIKSLGFRWNGDAWVLYITARWDGREWVFSGDFESLKKKLAEAGVPYVSNKGEIKGDAAFTVFIPTKREFVF